MTSIRQKLWLKIKTFAKAASSKFDLQDAMWFLATALVVRGVWVLFGDGYAYLSAGAMVAIPSIVAWIILGQSMKDGDK